jgi:ABC-type methionine transport system permease subunit
MLAGYVGYDLKIMNIVLALLVALVFIIQHTGNLYALAVIA